MYELWSCSTCARGRASFVAVSICCACWYLYLGFVPFTAKLGVFFFGCLAFALVSCASSSNSGLLFLVCLFFSTFLYSVFLCPKLTLSRTQTNRKVGKVVWKHETSFFKRRRQDKYP